MRSIVDFLNYLQPKQGAGTIMKQLFMRISNVVIVSAITVAVFRITHFLLRILWTSAYQSDSCWLTFVVSRTIWMPAILASLVAIMSGLCAINMMRKNRRVFVTWSGLVALILLVVKYDIESVAIPVNGKFLQNVDGSTVFFADTPSHSLPIMLKCYSSIEGQDVEFSDMIFDNRDIKEFELAISPVDDTYSVKLRLRKSATHRIRQMTSHPNSSKYLCFFTNDVFMAKLAIQEPINNGTLFLPTQSESDAMDIIEGIYEYLWME